MAKLSTTQPLCEVASPSASFLEAQAIAADYGVLFRQSSVLDVQRSARAAFDAIDRGRGRLSKFARWRMRSWHRVP